MVRSRGLIRVGKIESNNAVGCGGRVWADVDGEVLWFESAEAKLCSSVSGFASALLIPAMSHGLDLLFEDALPESWLKNAGELMGVLSEWWGWPIIDIGSLGGIFKDKCGEVGEPYLFFSGGVDSFYSLLKYPVRPRRLVMVHGYDIRLEDKVGAAMAFDHVRAVAERVGAEAIMITSNYREHHVAGKKYKFAYAGALFGVAHIIEGCSHAVLSSGFTVEEAEKNGSHWRTDPLWGSSDMQAVHFGASMTRNQKIRSIAGDALFQKHLRVCQSNYYDDFDLGAGYLNCGRCMKCLRTLLVLSQEIDVRCCDSFSSVDDFNEGLWGALWVGEALYSTYRDILLYEKDSSIRAAVEALLHRSYFYSRVGFLGDRLSGALIYLFRFYQLLGRRS